MVSLMNFYNIHVVSFIDFGLTKKIYVVDVSEPEFAYESMGGGYLLLDWVIYLFLV